MKAIEAPSPMCPASQTGATPTMSNAGSETLACAGVAKPTRRKDVVTSEAKNFFSNFFL
jgi:hypothetical protein